MPLRLDLPRRGFQRAETPPFASHDRAGKASLDYLHKPPHTPFGRASGARGIPIQAHEVNQTLECARCGRRFVPSRPQEASSPGPALPPGVDGCEDNWDSPTVVPDPTIYKSGDADKVTLTGSGISVVHFAL